MFSPVLPPFCTCAPSASAGTSASAVPCERDIGSPNVYSSNRWCACGCWPAPFRVRSRCWVRRTRTTSCPTRRRAPSTTAPSRCSARWPPSTRPCCSWWARTPPRCTCCDARRASARRRAPISSSTTPPAPTTCSERRRRFQPTAGASASGRLNCLSRKSGCLSTRRRRCWGWCLRHSCCAGRRSSCSTSWRRCVRRTCRPTPRSPPSSCGWATSPRASTPSSTPSSTARSARRCSACCAAGARLRLRPPTGCVGATRCAPPAAASAWAPFRRRCRPRREPSPPDFLSAVCRRPEATRTLHRDVISPVLLAAPQRRPANVVAAALQTPARRTHTNKMIMRARAHHLFSIPIPPAPLTPSHLLQCGRMFFK